MRFLVGLCFFGLAVRDAETGLDGVALDGGRSCQLSRRAWVSGVYCLRESAEFVVIPPLFVFVSISLLVETADSLRSLFSSCDACFPLEGPQQQPSSWSSLACAMRVKRQRSDENHGKPVDHGAEQDAHVAVATVVPAGQSVKPFFTQANDADAGPVRSAAPGWAAGVGGEVHAILR